MTWKNRIQERANPDCPDCGGEGICCYAIGDDGYDDICDTCFPNGWSDDDEGYDAWKDDQLRDDIEA